MLRNVLIVMLCMLMQTIALAEEVLHTKVLVIGGGTSGTAAAIQSARLGVPTILVEQGPWLGGMISAAGVSAIDGNHRIPSGIWNEFREALYKVYGGPAKVATGWVSNTQFEPHIADSIFKSMTKACKQLQVMHGFGYTSIIKKGNKIIGAVFTNTGNGKKITINAEQVIDATELGDVLADAGAKYDVGMEASSVSGEDVGVTASNDIIQDFTYVAVLKDYGKGADRTIVKPIGYDPTEFDGACTNYYIDKTRKAPNVDAQKMLDYGKLPNGKYMINWPGYGNDYYANVITMSSAERAKAIEQSKQQTLRFVYFIQHQLGFKHYGLTEDEFPTKDHLALMPYFRESRRVKGEVRFNIKHIVEPYSYSFYRTGIAVGDYPIDHHHKKNPDAPQHLNFYPVPSYNIPLGTLIPQGIDGLIVAEKNISVSNVVNGTTRLQPVVLLIGQAAGTIAALSVKEAKAANKIAIRKVQQQLLDSKALLLPFIDAGIAHPQFHVIQRVGATGILKGKGIPYQWANQTWFYPDSTITEIDFLAGIHSFNNSWLKNVKAGNHTLTTPKAISWVTKLAKETRGKNISDQQVRTALQKKKLYEQNIQRKALAWLLDTYVNPFSLQINFQGNLL